MELNIYVRKDLNMRKGKMSAQVAHAACAQLLRAMHDHGDYRVLPTSAYWTLQDFLDSPTVNIHLVSGDEQALQAALKSPAAASIIIDRGLTEFGGVPTMTCAAEGLFTPTTEPARPRVASPPAEELFARQWLVFSKERPLPKEIAAQLGAIGCLQMMATLMTPDEQGQGVLSLRKSLALDVWLTSGFGKIGMGIKTDQQLIELRDDLHAAGIKTVEVQHGEQRLLVIGPELPERVAGSMGRESERYTQGILSLL